MKFVFIDAEYTGEHAYTTLVSIGLVTLEGEALYVTLNDYDEEQVTPWLRQNVLSLIDQTLSVSSAEAYLRVSAWLKRHSGGEPIHLVSAGLGSDLLLLFELWKHSSPGARYFHALHHLPPYLNHAQHFDLNTLMFLVGGDPNSERESFLGRPTSSARHNAMHDAMVVRECFLRLMDSKELHRLSEQLAK